MGEDRERIIPAIPRNIPTEQRKSTFLMLAMAKSINAAIFGGILLTLPLAVAGLPRGSNPFLTPHAATTAPQMVSPAKVRPRHPGHHHRAIVLPGARGF